jgi:hypothetical protein
VGDVLKDLGPLAEKAGVILGLEDTVSAEDNVRMMERSGSKAVLTYYDRGKSTGSARSGSASFISKTTRTTSGKARLTFRRSCRPSRKSAGRVTRTWRRSPPQK